jgi:transposase
MAIDKDTRGYIRYLHFKQAYPISKITEQTGVSRKTIRDILQDKQPCNKRTTPSKLDAFKEQIQSILAQKPGMTTTLILEAIRAQGFGGGKSIVYDYVAQLRKRQKEAYLPLQTLAGEQAQVDWAHCGTICCGQHHRKLYVFCMTLSYSRYLYIEFTISMDMDTFLACHIHAFHFFEGVPKTILYDNLKSVVIGRIGQEISFNHRHLDFALHYDFSPQPCNIGKAHEKGKVERMIDYIKGNFMKRGPYENFDHIKLETKNWLRLIANKRLHTVTRKVPETSFLQEEQQHLLKLPAIGYDCYSPIVVTVTKQCLVIFQTNKYSVPAEYAYQTVIVKATTTELNIYSHNNQIATHRRCYDKFQLITNPDHYKKLLEQKRRASVHLEIEKFEQLSIESKAYLSGLLNYQKNVHYHVKKIFELVALFGKTAVSGAIAKALAHEAFHWEYIKNIILESNLVTYNVPVSPRYASDILDIDVQTPDLSKYDEVSDHD